MFKYQGTKAVMEDTSRLVEEVSTKFGATEFSYFGDQKEADDIWNLRKGAFNAVMSGYPEHRAIVTDVW
jgi:hypothetical protein